MPTSALDDSLAQVSALINSHNLVDAYHLIRALLQDNQPDPRLWHQMILLDLLLQDPDFAQTHLEVARGQCGDAWDDTYEGDVLRDMALYHIRNGQDLQLAEQHITSAEQHHAGDPNRLAALQMARGRLAYVRHDLEDAIVCYSAAVQIWDRLDTGQADQQWYFNCLRWYIKALVADRRLHQDITQGMWHDIQQRRRAQCSQQQYNSLWLIMHFGRPANWLDDRLQRRLLGRSNPASS